MLFDSQYERELSTTKKIIVIFLLANFLRVYAVYSLFKKKFLKYTIYMEYALWEHYCLCPSIFDENSIASPLLQSIWNMTHIVFSVLFNNLF